MGKLRITDQGLKHYGEAEFVGELRANLIRPSQVRYYTMVMYYCIGLSVRMLPLSPYWVGSIAWPSFSAHFVNMRKE